MPPYVYNTPENPYVGSIGEMLARRGDIAAARAINVANAQAGGVVGSANAWAGAARDISTNVGGQLMKAGQQMADPAYQADKLRLEQLRRDRESQMTIEAAVTNPANWKEDGSGVDDSKVASFLQKSGNGHAAVAWNTIAAANAKNRIEMAKTLADINASNATTAEKQAALVAKQRGYVSELAFHTEQAMGPSGASDPVHARDTFMAAVAHAAVDGGLTKDMAQSVLQRTAGATPAQMREVLASLVDPNDRSKLEGAAAETKLKGAQAAEAQAKADAVAKYGTSGMPPAAQAKSYRVNLPGGGTKDVPLEFVPGRSAADPGSFFLNQPGGQRVQMYPGKDFVDVPAPSVQVNAAAAAATQNLPGWALDASRPAKGAEGNALDPKLHMTPNGLFQDAQTYIATGSYPPTGRGGDPVSVAKRTAIDAKVGAIAAEAGMDVPTLRAFYRANAKSLQAQQGYLDAAQSFMATADKNSDLLEKALGKTPDLGAPVLNTPWRTFQQQVLGSEDMSQFRTYLQSIRNEYGKIITNPNLSGQFTDSAREEAGHLLADDATVGQVLTSVKALKAEGSNRILSLGEQITKIAARMQRPDQPPPPAGGGAGPKKGDVRPVAGFPGAEQTYNGVTWIRSK